MSLFLMGEITQYLKKISGHGHKYLAYYDLRIVTFIYYIYINTCTHSSITYTQYIIFVCMYECLMCIWTFIKHVLTIP